MAPTTRTTRSCAKIPSLTGAQIEKPGIAENKPTAGESSARRKVLPGKKQPPTSSRQLTRLDHIILEGVNDSKVFLDMFYWPDVDLTRIRVLEVHLNATKPDEYADYRLTRVLNELQPNADGTNPHNLHAVKLVVKGNVLYTRYSYSLASPAMSQDASDGLRKLVTNGLSEQEKINLRYKVYGTEKIVARALLGIRGVRQVVIEGKGKMEGQFAETIKATLIQPPGTSISEQGRALVPNSTGWLYGEGLFASGTWDCKHYRSCFVSDLGSKHEFTLVTDIMRPSNHERTIAKSLVLPFGGKYSTH